MRFRRGARLDPGQVTDVRGRSFGTGGLAVGGGGLGLAALVVFLLFSLLSGGNGGLGQLAPLDGAQVGQGSGSTPSDIREECRTGQDANEREDCRIVGVVNSVQRFWSGVFQRSGKRYQDVNTVFFTDQVQTGCGFASSQVGPFYCPADKLVYIDLGFLTSSSRGSARRTARSSRPT
jgi:predicted metalloprotease